MIKSAVMLNNLFAEYYRQSNNNEQYNFAHTDCHTDAYFTDGECNSDGSSKVSHTDSHHDF